VITMLHADCMEYMAGCSDKAFELAIVDPPYGIGEDGESNNSRGSKKAKATEYKKKEWDKEPPTIEYFQELKRVSKNQIIWGANHFISRIPFDSPCWVVWDKQRTGDFADCELAYTSFNTAVRKFVYCWNGFSQGILGRSTGATKETRIHPTQKPVALYKWLLSRYAKPGDRILDTHGGSGSICIAAHDLGFNLTWMELDADYYSAAVERYKNHAAQAQFFIPEQKTPEQMELLCQ
jgi:site-specific DNA-methyltransferase (adenine-specific)